MHDAVDARFHLEADQEAALRGGADVDRVGLLAVMSSARPADVAAIAAL
jgi:hypothetical protein